MTKAHASVNDWKALYTTTYHGILVGDLCRSLPQHISIFKRVSVVCVCVCVCACACDSVYVYVCFVLQGGDRLGEELERVASLIDKVVSSSAVAYYSTALLGLYDHYYT